MGSKHKVVFNERRPYSLNGLSSSLLQMLGEIVSKSEIPRGGSLGMELVGT